MQLSIEDNLKLNILLTQKLLALKIDESKMCLLALTEKGEAKIELNPTTTDERYIKEIKSLLSSHVMGSPSGYPVYIKGWTRMGQARDESLERLLKLAEPEAVVAVVHANGLTDELARRAWWAMPNAENARCMLEKTAVVKGQTGKILAQFLLEFLPFEAEHSQMIASARLVLQTDLITSQQKQLLWKKAKTKKSIYVGFLLSCPNNLPMQTEPHPQYATIKPQLSLQIEQGNQYAILLNTVLSAQGQAFLSTVEQVLKKPINQDVVVSLMSAISDYFVKITPKNFSKNNIEQIITQAQAFISADTAQIKELLTLENNTVQNKKDLAEKLSAMLSLSCLSGALFTPIFSRSDAIGSVMRKKIKPMTQQIFALLNQLKTQ